MDSSAKSIAKVKDHFSFNHLSVNPYFQFQLFTEPYLEQVVDVFTRAFCLFEPMTAYLKMDMTLYKNFARIVAENAVQDQLSVIALQEGKVAAIALVEDLARPCDIPDFDPKFKNILALLDRLGKDYFSKRTIKPLEISHLFITAVDEKFRRQNLSTQVNFQAMNISSRAGFKEMYCEFTHPYNEQGVIPHLKMPYTLIGAQVYKDFVFQNKKPFAQLSGGAKSYLWQI